MEGCSDPIDASSTRRYGTGAWRKPPWLGKGEQKDRSLILVTGSVPLKYCPPTCVHMAKTRAPGDGPDKGTLCSRDVLFMPSFDAQTSPAILLPWARRSPAFVLWELQRGAGTLLACRTWCSATRATAPPPQAWSETAGSAPEIAIAFPILLVYYARSPGCSAGVAGAAQDQRWVPPASLLSQAWSTVLSEDTGTVPCSQPGFQWQDKATCKQSNNRRVSLSLTLIISN